MIFNVETCDCTDCMVVSPIWYCLVSPKDTASNISGKRPMCQQDRLWKQCDVIDALILILAYIVGFGLVHYTPVAVGGWSLQMPIRDSTIVSALRGLALGTALAMTLILVRQYAIRKRRSWMSRGEQAAIVHISIIIVMNVMNGCMNMTIHALSESLMSVVLILLISLLWAFLVGATIFYTYASIQVLWKGLHGRNSASCLWTDQYGSLGFLLFETLPVFVIVASVVWAWWAMGSGPH